jgi:outer membrane protein assembly factor BamA
MWIVPGAAVLAALLSSPATMPRQASPAQAVGEEAFDIGDLIRKLLHKEAAPDDQRAPGSKRSMRAVAPVIGYKPSTGATIGVAGNVASFRGDPATTPISSTVASITFSAKKQTSLTARSAIYGANDRWAFDGDNRAQWTSQDTFGLGTTTGSDDLVNMKFDYFRFYETAFHRITGNLMGGIGFHFSAHTNAEPGKDAEGAWDDSPFVIYSETHGFSLDSQTSAGIGLNLRYDSRDSGINPSGGLLASVSYRPFFKDFIGGDSTWQELYLDARTYKSFDNRGRQKLAFWLWGDLVTGGVAPYLDLPATGADNYGRSARGYSDGRFRGERLLYGEVEYRATLTRNRFVGMVAFLNTSTLANSESGERLFDHFATGGGAGLRLLLNKRSNTNLCFDVGVGRDGSHGIYLAVQEAF